MPERDRCRICNSRTNVVFSLGDQPLANNFKESVETHETFYPLDLHHCSDCNFYQLGYTVPPEQMYSHYLYIPSISTTNMDHFKGIARKTVEGLELPQNSLVVDIGSNNGSLLKFYQELGMKTLGIEPALNLANYANTHGIFTIHSLFNETLGQTLAERYGRAKLVTAINVFAHIDDLYGFIRGVDTLLNEDGVFFAQFPDARHLFRQNQLDTIYHEHLSYFTHESLYRLFNRTNLEIFNIEETDLHGGSMQIWARRKEPLLEKFIEHAEITRAGLHIVLSMYRRLGKTVVGFGAAAKGTVLLNYCNLGNYVDYVVDGTPEKQGKFIPGVNLPIYPEEKLLEEPPGSVVLLLAWNFQDEIMDKLKGRRFIFVTPIPKVDVINEGVLYENSNS